MPCESLARGYLDGRRPVGAAAVRAIKSEVPKMSSELKDPETPQPVGLVERLVRDDLDRKRFLKMAGTAGAASFGAFVLAACGSSKTSSTSSTTAAATTAATGATSASATTTDIGILNYALTLEYLETEF